MIHLKTGPEVAAMAVAGAVVARVLAAVRDAATVGRSLLELDELARSVLAGAGATSPFLGYRPAGATVPFPAVVCTSVNDAVLHGIPTGYRLQEGDLLSIDAGATVDGWVADAAASFCVGVARPEDRRLVEATEAALRRGIAAARPGGRLGDISAAVGATARAAGYGLHTDFGGHGVGRAMHEPPHIPNDGRAGRGLRLVPGLVLAIEPWFMAGGQDGYRIDDDGWTVRSHDGSRAAHAEHTVAVTDGGPVVLTRGRSDG